MGCIQQNNVGEPSKLNNLNQVLLQQSKNRVTRIKSIEEYVVQNGLVQEQFGKISKDYVIQHPPLGRGANGEVCRAIHRMTEAVRAIKIISKYHTTASHVESFRQEVAILKQLDHPNIIRVYEFWQDNNFFYIVTDLCTGGELFNKIIEERIFNEQKAAEMMIQILRAVFYCHKNGIVHRDLKPENILLESKNSGAQLKIVDFGTSRIFSDNQKMSQKLGTPYYIAPEVLQRNYTEKCDIWSCGVILYILLCGQPPFSGENENVFNVILEKVKSGKYSFDSNDWLNVSSDAKLFITKMLQKDINKRYSAEQALNDPWLKRFIFKDAKDMPEINNALNNMRSFRVNDFYQLLKKAEKKLKEATWIFIINAMTSREEKCQLIKAFQALDLNNDGMLQREELVMGYRRMMSEEEAEEEVDRIMSNVDKNNSNAIDYSEFLMACVDKNKVLSKQNLEIAFKVFDKDRSGTISIDEIKQILGGSQNIDQKVWEDVLKEVDQNGDGLISLDEFYQMMTSNT